MKTKRCAAKRYKKTASGKLKYAHMGGSHILTNKNRKQKRRLGGENIVDPADHKRIAKTIPYA